MTSEIKSEMHGAVQVVTFVRPQTGNALTLDMATQLFNLLKATTTDRAIRVLLLQGAGGNFMDGLDIQFYAGEFASALAHANQLTQPYNSIIRELQLMEKPVIAACRGMTAGPGLSVMLAGDLAIAGRSAKFQGKFATLATTPDGGCAFMLARKVGAAKACEILMLDEAFDAATAERLGLVNKIVDDDKLESEALAWAEKLADGPTRSYGGTKRLVMKAFEQDLNAQLGVEHSIWGGVSRTFDFREAIRAHFAKRPTKFTGA